MCFVTRYYPAHTGIGRRYEHLHPVQPILGPEVPGESVMTKCIQRKFGVPAQYTLEVGCVSVCVCMRVCGYEGGWM